MQGPACGVGFFPKELNDWLTDVMAKSGPFLVIFLKCFEDIAFSFFYREPENEEVFHPMGQRFFTKRSWNRRNFLAAFFLAFRRNRQPSLITMPLLAFPLCCILEPGQPFCQAEESRQLKKQAAHSRNKD